MEKQNLRVIVASEYLQARDLLKEVVEKEKGAFLVGQAQEGTKAVTLARNLRPDVAIIDSNLPYSVGLDSVRLSRMGGLDTAQIISEAMPSSRVVIITNLDRQVLMERSLSLGGRSFFSRERIGGSAPFKLQELCHEMVVSEAPVFANVEVEAWPTHQEEQAQSTDRAIAFGTVSIGGGLYLIGTLWLAPYGVLLLLAGVVALGLGLLRRATARLWGKTR